MDIGLNQASPFLMKNVNSSMGMTTSKPTVQGSLEIQEGALSDLLLTINELESRLNSVLEQVPPAANSVQQNEPKNIVPNIINIVNENTVFLRKQTEHLQSIINRLHI